MAFLYNNFEFLYLNPEYRITDSSTEGNATVNANLRFSGPLMAYSFVNDRGQIACAVAPTEPLSQKDWFRISIVRQYVEGADQEEALSSNDTASWVAENFGRVESLFTPDSVGRSIDAMRTLKRQSADRRFGPV